MTEYAVVFTKYLGGKALTFESGKMDPKTTVAAARDLMQEGWRYSFGPSRGGERNFALVEYRDNKISRVVNPESFEKIMK